MLAEWMSALDEIPGYLIVDAKSVYDMLIKESSAPSEKRTALDTLAVREALNRPNDHIRWVPTRHMLADAMTKCMLTADYLDDVLADASLSLIESPEAKAMLEQKGDLGKTAS